MLGRAIPILAAIALTGCAGGAGPGDPVTVAASAAAATISPEDIHERISFLASDELRGRDTPSPGLDRAAEYLSEQFEGMGLESAGDPASYLQRYPFSSTEIDASELVFRVEGETDAPMYLEDFFVIPGMTESFSAAPVFAGPATGAASVDAAELSERFVLWTVSGAEPDAEWGAQLTPAVGTSLQAGAAGVGLILDPEFTSASIRELAPQVGGQQAPFPVVGISREAGIGMIRQAGGDLDALMAAVQAGEGPQPVDGAEFEVRTPTTTIQDTVPNVVAMLPGSDPMLRETYVVYTAHFDHVGVGEPDEDGDSIYNGADDDASGTAALVEIAEAFAALPIAPARSIVFLAVSAEEKGLLGSRHFVENPTVPLGQMVANINMDMVGRNHPDSVIAIGQEYSTLGPLVQEVAAARPELQLVVAPDLWPEERLFFRSDHYNFAQNGVPAIFFTTGLHDQYHRPDDEIDLIDADKNARIARLAFYLGHAIASTREAPEWTEEGLEQVEPATAGRD